ncbi:MAG: T9SS type A sorting domain-containing protein [Bacteroidia bacterium]|nr:T9SS type A sorting domain-containing protein [Bacteroidia bacterium]
MRNILVLFLTLCLQQLQAQVNLNSSLTACYPLNGNAMENINSLNGTLSLVTSTIDRFGNSNSAYAFSGDSTSFIELPNSPLLKANAVSFSAWVRFNQLNTVQYIVFTHNGCFNYHEGYMLCVNNWVPGGFRLQMAKADNSCSFQGQATLNGSQVLSPLTWYHVGFYVGSDSLKLYLNGNLETSLANSNPIVYNSSTNVYLGGSNISTFNAYLDGCLDNVRFYNRKLNGAEMSALYTLDPVCRPDAVGLPSGFEEIKSVSLFPNPVETFLSIENKIVQEITGYSVEDATGRVMMKGDLAQKEQTKIDCSQLLNGIYFLKLRSNSNEIVKKFVKH